jgi:hypothetical protein
MLTKTAATSIIKEALPLVHSNWQDRADQLTYLQNIWFTEDISLCCFPSNPFSCLCFIRYEQNTAKQQMDCKQVVNSKRYPIV